MVDYSKFIKKKSSNQNSLALSLVLTPVQLLALGPAVDNHLAARALAQLAVATNAIVAVDAYLQNKSKLSQTMLSDGCILYDLSF